MGPEYAGAQKHRRAGVDARRRPARSPSRRQGIRRCHPTLFMELKDLRANGIRTRRLASCRAVGSRTRSESLVGRPASSMAMPPGCAVVRSSVPDGRSRYQSRVFRPQGVTQMPLPGTHGRGNPVRPQIRIVQPRQQHGLRRRRDGRRAGCCASRLLGGILLGLTHHTARLTNPECSDACPYPSLGLRVRCRPAPSLVPSSNEHARALTLSPPRYQELSQPTGDPSTGEASDSLDERNTRAPQGTGFHEAAHDRRSGHRLRCRRWRRGLGCRDALPPRTRLPRPWSARPRAPSVKASRPPARSNRLNGRTCPLPSAGPSPRCRLPLVTRSRSAQLSPQSTLPTSGPRSPRRRPTSAPPRTS